MVNKPSDFPAFSPSTKPGWRPGIIWLIYPLLLIASCSTDYLAPLSERGEVPQWRPNQYQIKPGDTLYSIAWEFGLDHRKLAQWNNIVIQDKIIAGQRIKLVPPPGRTSPPLSTGHTRPSTAGVRSTGKKVTTTQKPVAARTTSPLNAGPIKWRWPTAGKVVTAYSPKLGHNRGLNIAGKVNQPVTAAASGVIVYAGEGIKAYGKMIIVKHSERYLSAYANNDKMLVREGQRVKAGETIARMGRRGDGETLLHFEIRRDGKPVNPMSYLPKRS